MHESQQKKDESQKEKKTKNSSPTFVKDFQKCDIPKKHSTKKPSNIAQHDGILLYVLVVGFHHKKGCMIEYCYPSLPNDNAAEIKTDENYDQSTNNDKVFEKGDPNSDSIDLPESWKTLPSLAIPDGAHNFDHDTVYFHLPDLNDPNKTVFGIACYQQIMTKQLLVKTPDMTRSSVQKSVVAILRYPLYGFVERKLRIITRGYFNELDFSQTLILKEFFKSMTLQLKPSMIDTHEIYYGLSLQQLFAKFGQQIITLFKLLLLEKKTLFIMSPIRELSSTILSLCSLFPGLLQKGMLQSHLPIELNEQIKSLHKDEKYCDKNLSEETKTESTNIEKTKPELQDSVESTISSYDNISLDDSLINPDHDYECDDDEPVSQKSFETEILIKPYEYYGLPLQLFKCNSYCLPYCSISCFECLNNERVRSCVAGSSNSIFQRWENDIDVFVVDNQVIINDPRLKRMVAPTVEDSRFISFLLQSINQTSITAMTKDLEIGESFGAKKMLISALMLNHQIDDEDLVDIQQPSKGSDAWCRFHFKNYLLHMLRCSFLDENSKEYCSFNQSFMSEWKMTYNYKTWSNNKSIVDIFQQEIDPQHPFAANRLNDIRFKITSFINNRQEHLNNASKVVLNTAKTTLTSWMTSLSSYGAGQQAKSILSRTVQTFATQFIEDGDDLSSSTESESDIDRPMRKAPRKQLQKSNDKEKKIQGRKTVAKNIDTKSEADSDLEVSMDEEQETSV